MYTVVIEHEDSQGNITKQIIHTDVAKYQTRKIQSATLDLEENTAGTFTFTVPIGQVGNGSGIAIKIETDEVAVYQNPDIDEQKNASSINTMDLGEEIWRGFFLNDGKDFFNTKTYSCIGELAYLNEVLQEEKEYSYSNDADYPSKILGSMLDIYNSKVPDKMKFYKGQVTVKGDSATPHLINRVVTGEFSTSNSDKTLDAILTLVKSLGGYLKITKDQNGRRFLNWLEDYEAYNENQTIEFGKNLLDYTISRDFTDMITVLYAYGESISTENADSTTTRKKVDLSTSTKNGGLKYYKDQEKVDTYGWREGYVNFPNVRDADNLYALAKSYYENQIRWTFYTTISCKAVDLAYFMDSNVPPLNFLQQVKVVSLPHGTTGAGQVFPITKMSIPLMSPEQTLYTMTTAMRKMKQISTSIADHDKDIEKTEDAIGDAGDGGGDEGEPEVVITGKDPTNDWTIGKPTVGKAPSEESETSYLKHQKHLKVWYDMSGEVTVNPENALVPIYEYNSSTQEWVQMERDVKVGYVDGSNYYESYGHTEPLGGAISKWEPTFISEDMKGIDDKSSRTYLSSTETVETNGYANVQDSFPISVYYAGPWIVPVVIANSTENHDIVVSMNHKTLAKTASLSDPQSAFWYGCQWAHYGNSDGVHFDVRGKLRELDDAPYVGGRYDYDKNLIPLYAPVSESGFANSRIFGSFAKGVLPMAQRPLMDGSTLCTVLYCVVNFGYGARGSTEQPIPGISANNRGFSVFSKPSNSSGTEVSRTKYGRLCWYYPGIPFVGNESIQVVALYEVDEIQDNLDEAMVTPYPMMPANRWWAYAWVRNVGPGTKYTFGSDVTGGLFVATSSGTVRTGCAKWTAEFNKSRSPAIQYAHAEEFMLAGSSNPKNQCVFINGRAPGPINNPRYVDPVTVTKEANERCYGHYGFGGQASWGGTSYTSHQLSALGIRAIGYCKAAYNQITTDEVVENLKFIANKYCGD